jgi:hypothetical protein
MSRSPLCCPLAQFPGQLYYDAARWQLIELLRFAMMAMCLASTALNRVLYLHLPITTPFFQTGRRTPPNRA